MRTIYRKQFYPNQWHRCRAEPMKMCLLLVLRVCDRHLADIGPWSVPKSDHVTITKIENLHIVTCRKIHWFQKCYSIGSKTKSNEVSAEKRFLNSGVTALSDAWIDVHRQYMFLADVGRAIILLFNGEDFSHTQLLYFAHRTYLVQVKSQLHK